MYWMLRRPLSFEMAVGINDPLIAKSCIPNSKTSNQIVKLKKKLKSIFKKDVNYVVVSYSF